MAEHNEPAHISELPSAEVPAEDLPTPQVPSRPHMPAAVIDFLESRLKEANCFLEYGAGGSTVLAASLNVPRIITVETDARFAQAVRKAAMRLRSKSVLHLITIKLGRTQEWGVPATFDAYQLWPAYALRPWEFLRKNDLSPDLVLIDGRFRVASFFASLLDAQPGTVIMFDDYLLRKAEYHFVESVIAPTKLIGLTAIFTVPDVIPLRQVARGLARYVTHPL